MALSGPTWGTELTGEGTGADAKPRRVIGRPVLPSGRAVVGGLLLALSGIGTFTAWHQATGVPDDAYVVTRRAVPPGTRLGQDDVRLLTTELAAGVSGAAYRDVDEVVGRVTLGPVGEGELLQAGQLTADSAAEPVLEVAMSLPADRAVDGRLRPGDRVDLFATFDGQTAQFATGIEVLAVTGAGLMPGSPTTQQTVTVALPPSVSRVDFVNAMRVGDVTLVRSTMAQEPAAAEDQP